MILLLIENKVNANLQPQQAKRYGERGQTYLAQGICDEFHTVLVAPERYFGSGESLKGFDGKVTYEAIRDWFQDQNWGDRQRYKTALLTAAIKKQELGYQPLADAPVTEFWRQYWQFIQAQAPELTMKEPVAKPAGAGFITLSAESLPKGVMLLHKLPHGNVDLQFSGMGERMDELRAKYKGCIDGDMSFAKAAKSGCIRLQVPPINTADSFAQQQEAVRQGVDAARRLLAWYEQLAER
jgi:hypothetical protein